MKIIRNILLGVGVVLMTIFYTLLSVIRTPFLAAKYRKTPFARDTGAAYEAGITDCEVYRLYNALRERNIPIEIIAHPKHPQEAHLLWKNTLIIHEIDSLCRREGRWVIGPDSDVWKEGLSLKEAIAEILDHVFDDLPGMELEDARILIDRADIAPADLPSAEQSEILLPYSDEAEQLQLLSRLCTNA